MRLCCSSDGPPYVRRSTAKSSLVADDSRDRARHSGDALMDVISIAIAVVSFALFFAVIEGLDRL
jgi:hypothetical protein